MSEPFTFRTLLDDAALLSLEYQLHLSDVLGEHSWTVDLNENSFEFDGVTPRRCTAFHLLGSAAPRPQTWLWAWANGSFPPELTRVAGEVRDFGSEFHIGELAEAEVSFAELPGAPSEPEQAQAVLTEAAKIVSGHWAAYHGDAGGGTRVSFLVEHPDFRLPPPDPARVMRVLHQGIGELDITDHRRAIYSYATRRPLDADAADDWSSVRLSAPGLDITVSFDRHLVSDIRGTLS